MSTIRTIVERADLLRENALPIEMKVEWISELDGLIALEVLKLDTSEMAQFRYNPETDMETQPLVRFPHDNIYHYWLCAKIDAENGEYKRYQNSMQLYNGAFVAFRTWFSRVYDVYNGDRKDPGFYLSAYALAVSRGFAGDLDAWLQSLVGPPGPQGPMGPVGSLLGVTEADNGAVMRVVGGQWAVDQTMPQQIQDLENAVRQLQYVPIAFESMSCSPATAEIGSGVQGVKLTWKLNKDVVSQTLNGMAVDAAAREFVVPAVIDGNTTFTVEAVDETGAAAQKSAGINFYNGIYCGVIAADATLNDATVRSLTRKLQAGRATTFTANAGAGKKLCYACPSRLGTPTINIGGFDYVWDKTTILFTNASGYSESYDVWVSPQAGLGETTVKVS